MLVGHQHVRRGSAAMLVVLATLLFALLAGPAAPAAAKVDAGVPPPTVTSGSVLHPTTSTRTPAHALTGLARSADPRSAPEVRRVAPPPPSDPEPTAPKEPANDEPKAPTRSGRVVTSTGGGTVSLTFDDGPSATWTPKVLDLLDQYGARATFFLVGSQVAAYPDLAREIVARGHRVAGHTMDHADLASLASSQWDRQIDQSNALIERTTGQKVTCVRPPYGSHNSTVDGRLADRGLDVAMWTIDPQDWGRPGAGVIADRVLSALRPGAVVLLHDGGGDRSQTVAALEQILRNADGTTFAPMC